ncbi:hypothetical protein KIN20_012587 [Parelaphostrongylus tenuis]|uniref:Uncharacterized protein n=1 Tax=Parelaphostrongylus tenuis TaxID=148309 RepID=A0AAD5QN92_PARTN|nr:hypothetical protein KIN20_012587 [Parelaphostrongylus tenuis]
MIVGQHEGHGCMILRDTESDLPEESSSSLQSCDDASSVLYDNETPEAFDDSGGGDESSTGDDVGSSTAMKNRSYYHLKPSARQFMGGVRTVEHVGSKCYSVSNAMLIFWKRRIAAVLAWENKIDSHAQIMAGRREECTRFQYGYRSMALRRIASGVAARAAPTCTPADGMNFMPICPHRLSISGALKTSNIIMETWNREIWQSVVNRVLRMLALGSFGTQFAMAVATVN